MEPVSARFEKFEPVHRVSGKIFFETGLQTGLSEPGHSPNIVNHSFTMKRLDFELATMLS